MGECLLTDGAYRVLIYASDYVSHFTLWTLPIVLCPNWFCYYLSQKLTAHKAPEVYISDFKLYTVLKSASSFSVY